MAKGQRLGKRESQNSDLIPYLPEAHHPEREAVPHHLGKQGSVCMPRHCIRNQESSVLPAPVFFVMCIEICCREVPRKT